MRAPTLLSIAVLTLGLGACGTMGAINPNSYAGQERQLADDCRGRGGILVPTGSQSAHPQTDNVCKINGQPSPLTRPN